MNKENVLFLILAFSSIYSVIFTSCIETEDYLVTINSIQLFIVSGNNQTAHTGEYLSETIVVRLGLGTGIGLPNKIITIYVIEGNGEAKNSVDTTDANGLIYIDWKMGYSPGMQIISVKSEGVEPIRILASAAPMPGIIEVISGDTQSAFVGDTLLNPIIVSVKDSSGNPVVGRKVKGISETGSGKLIAHDDTTDSNGMASFKWIIGTTLGVQKIILSAGTASSAEAEAIVQQTPPDQEIIVFNNSLIKYPSSQTISTNIDLPNTSYYNIEAILELNSPCESCSDSDCDPWDRIGNITIDAITPGGGTIQLELIRFITPYGNSNIYVQDVSQFTSLLRGNVKFNGYISTFLGQWNITFKLRFKNATLNNSYYMASPIIFDNAMFFYEELQALDITIPDNDQVILTYFATGHNNQGRNCDEFCQKINRIYVDNELVYEFTPWREDCTDLELNKCGNPGSVVLDRAGWCPGFIVNPTVLNVGKLSPGKHIFKIHVVNVEENGGYWRTSLSVVAKK